MTSVKRHSVGVVSLTDVSKAPNGERLCSTAPQPPCQASCFVEKRAQEWWFEIVEDTLFPAPGAPCSANARGEYDKRGGGLNLSLSKL